MKVVKRYKFQARCMLKRVERKKKKVTSRMLHAQAVSCLKKSYKLKIKATALHELAEVKKRKEKLEAQCKKNKKHNAMIAKKMMKKHTQAWNMKHKQQ